MGIPGDRDRLSMKIIRDVEGSAHTRSITSLHHDAMMRPWPPEISRTLADPALVSDVPPGAKKLIFS